MSLCIVMTQSTKTMKDTVEASTNKAQICEAVLLRKHNYLTQFIRLSIHNPHATLQSATTQR